MQQMNVVILTTYELVMSLIFGVVTIVFATKLMNRFVLSLPVEEFIRLKHKAGCLISGSLIFSVVYLTRGSVEQSTLALQSLVNANHGFGLKPLLIALVYFVVFYLISLFLSFYVLFLFSKIYRFIMSEIDIDAEIEKKDNLALAIFLSVILMGLVQFLDKPMSHTLGSLVFHEYLEKL